MSSPRIHAGKRGVSAKAEVAKSPAAEVKAKVADPAKVDAPKDEVVEGAKAAPQKAKHEHRARAQSQHAHSARQTESGVFDISESGALSKALKGALGKLGELASAAEMNAFVDAAVKGGVSPESLTDSIISGKGALFEALSPKLTVESLMALSQRLDTKTATPEANKAYQARLDGLQALATSGKIAAYAEIPKDAPTTIAGTVETPAAAGPPPKEGSIEWGVASIKPGLFLNATEMTALIKQLGPNGAAMIADQLLVKGNRLHPMMTMDALNALMSRLDPAGMKEGVADGLMALNGKLPPTDVEPITHGGGLAPLMRAGFMGTAANAEYAAMQAGVMPTGNPSFDLANAVVNSAPFSPTEKALLDGIEDPQQRAMQALQMHMQKQALLATMLSNLANMRHEMMKAVADMASRTSK